MKDLLLSTKNSDEFVKEVASEVVKQIMPLFQTSKKSEAELLTIEEATKFLHLSKPTLYSKVSRNEIPYMKKGKRLYFSTEELTEFIKSGKVKTNDEIEDEALEYLKIKKGGYGAK